MAGRAGEAATLGSEPVFLAKVDNPRGWATNSAPRSKRSLDLRSAATRLLGVDQLLVSPLAKGSLHDVFALDARGIPPAIARISRGAGGHGGMAVSKAVMDRLASDGIRAPRHLGGDSTRAVVPYEFEIQTRLQGEPLSRWDDDDEAFAPLLGRAAALLARVHSISVEGFGLLDPVKAASSPTRLSGSCLSWSEYLSAQAEVHISALERASIVDCRVADAVRRHFERLSCRMCSEPRLLHGDPGSANFIVDEVGEVGLVDWDDALAGDPLFDLAGFAAFQPMRRWSAIFSGYTEVMPLDEKKAELFWLYFLRIAVARQVHRSRAGIVDKPGRVPSVIRIHQALHHLEVSPCAYL